MAKFRVFPPIEMMKPLFLYITSSETAVSALLVAEDEKRQKQVFYFSRTLQGAEYPLLQTLHKPDMSGRLTKWAIELSGYDIKFVPAKAILKEQVLADFIAELSPEQKTKEKTDEVWIMKVDGSTGKVGCRAGIVLESKEGLRFEHVIDFNFQTTNNVAKYEALITRLELAKDLGIRALEIYIDSQLVANQVEGAY